MQVQYTARSDAGLSRDGNEDSGVAGPNVLAVADGMGGHAAGEVASQAAVLEFAQAGSAGAARSLLDFLAALLDAANDRIRRLAGDAPDREGMGTTATVVVPGDGESSQVAVGHIGDSRAYLFHDGSLRRLTHDHTLVQTLIDNQQITPAEARQHPARSVVTKVLQGQPAADPDLSLVDVEPGDRILICSDGLTDVIADDTIARLLGSAATVDEAAEALIRHTLDGGAPDNVTIVLAEIMDTASAADAATGPDDELYLVGAATLPLP